MFGVKLDAAVYAEQGFRARDRLAAQAQRKVPVRTDRHVAAQCIVLNIAPSRSRTLGASRS